MVKWKLYAMPNTEENIKAVEKEQYKRISKGYILVYSPTDLCITSGDYHIIDESEISYLTDSEKLWLLENNMRIIANESMEKSEEILSSFNDKLNRLEAELEKESKNIEEQ